MSHTASNNYILQYILEDFLNARHCAFHYYTDTTVIDIYFQDSAFSNKLPCVFLIFCSLFSSWNTFKLLHFSIISLCLPRCSSLDSLQGV